MPVGGIKEKCMAAHRNGIRNVILPERNKDDLSDLPADLRSQLNIHLADTLQKYLELALEKDLDSEFLRDQSYIALKHSDGPANSLIEIHPKL